jgi:hypothetical protein
VAGWRAGVPYLPVHEDRAGGDAWQALLVASGRSPGWSPVAGG